MDQRVVVSVNPETKSFEYVSLSHRERQDWRWLLKSAQGRYWSPNKREMRKIIEAGHKPLSRITTEKEALQVGRSLGLAGFGEFAKMVRRALGLKSDEKIPTHDDSIKALRCHFPKVSTRRLKKALKELDAVAVEAPDAQG